MPVRSSVAVFAITALLASGCGGDDEPPPSSAAKEDVPTQATTAEAPAETALDSEEAKQEAFEAIRTAFDPERPPRERCESMSDDLRKGFIRELARNKNVGVPGGSYETTVAGCVQIIEDYDTAGEAIENVYPAIDTTLDEYNHQTFIPPAEFETYEIPREAEAAWYFELSDCQILEAIRQDDKWFAQTVEQLGGPDCL